MRPPRNRLGSSRIGRSSGKIPPRAQTIAVAYDGERTEDRYFRGWKLKLGTVGAQIKPYFVRSGGNVLEAVRICIDRAKSDGPFSEVYCVCDIDDTSNMDIVTAKNLAASENIILCLSNRSFEVWLALHWEPVSLAPIVNEKDAISLVARHYQTYHKKCKEVPFDTLYSKTETAIKNAEFLSNQNLMNPSTNVHSLIKKLAEIYKKRVQKARS